MHLKNRIALRSAVLLVALMSTVPCVADGMSATCTDLTGMITSTYDTDGSAKFAGASIRMKNGSVIDLDAQPLQGGSGQVTWMTGKVNGAIKEFTVSLWQAKGVCKGQKCTYCQKNRYHMEGRTFDSGWRPCVAAGWQ